MKSFTYKPEGFASMRKVTIPSACKQLDSCMAFYEVQNMTLDKDSNALHRTLVVTKYILWSYETPIIEFAMMQDKDNNTLTIHSTVNEDSYRASRSTIKQLSRFIRLVMREFEIPYTSFDYHTLKDAMRSNRMHFFCDTSLAIKNTMYKDNVVVSIYRKNTAEFFKYVDKRGYAKPISCMI